MSVSAFDHIAIPIERVVEMLCFYDLLGFNVSKMEESFYIAQFGHNKIHMHLPELWKSAEFTLRGPNALPGSGDFCFVWNGSLAELLQKLQTCGIDVEEGPVDRMGGRNQGKEVGQSVYVRDPDLNLLEFIVYQ